MTRDEAIEKAVAAHQFGNPVCAFVDMAEALGMLKLDEPKTIAQRVYAAIGDESWTRGTILGALARAGLKIVEK